MVFFSIMIIMAISLSSALDFDFQYPADINAEEEFEVNIISETSENYDVKIYVFDDTQEYSEIYDFTRWRSPFNYIPESFPTERVYRLISHYAGESEICVKLRKSSDQENVSQSCKPIKVTQLDIPENESLETEEEPEEQAPESRPRKEPAENIVEPLPAFKTQAADIDEVVILNPRVEEPIFMTQEQKFRLWILYAFTFLCLIIIIFLSFRVL